MAATPTSSIGFQNFYSTTLSADLTASATDIFLTVVPSVSESFLVINPDSTTSREIIYYNSKTATKVVCPSVADGRGQGDTSASAHLTGTTVIMAPIAEYFETLLSLFTTSPQGWTSGSGTISAVTNNGNRSYTLTTSADLSGTISNGMRLRTTNTVAGPTQCTSLNGTNQYWSKSSPSGMTFTDDFVVSAWVKLSSYQAGYIVSRWNGTNGWLLLVNTDGTINLSATNGASTNYRRIVSCQSLPLNKWVHITAQLDMSAYTATPTTCYMMFDGVDVPVQLGQSGTNPTSLVQAGDLCIGSNSGVTFFPGKIASVFVSSAKITQANIRTLMSQTLTSSDISTNSIVSAYSFDGNANDLNTTNANNLTAQNSAAATDADSYTGVQAGGSVSSTLNYAIVTDVTSSTLTVQVPEGCTIPTSGGISAFSYSTYKAPYGFPGQKGKWEVLSLFGVDTTQASPTALTWYNISSAKITIPVGCWGLRYEGAGVASGTSTTTMLATLSTSASAESEKRLTSAIRLGGSNIEATMARQIDVAVDTTAVPFYMLSQTANGSATLIGFYGATRGITTIAAENAYL